MDPEKEKRNEEDKKRENQSIVFDVLGLVSNICWGLLLVCE